MKSRAVCVICGSKFIGNSGKACYCSDYCREIGSRAVRNAWARQRYEHRPKIKDMICVKCGKPYRGHFNSKYCDHCLESGKWRMRYYLECRAYTEQNADKEE